MLSIVFIKLCNIFLFIIVEIECRRRGRGRGNRFTKQKKIRLEIDQDLMLGTINETNQHIFVANSVIPFHHTSYEEQLKWKEQQANNLCKKLGKNLQYIRTTMNYIYATIVPSPITTAYRNKDEFSVRHGVDWNPKTVGFLVGKLSIGRAMCVPPTHLKSIKESHKEIAKCFQEYIRLSGQPTCLTFGQGFWRLLIVRSNEVGDLMACAIVYPFISTTGTEIEMLKMQQYFEKRFPKITLMYQVCAQSRCTQEEAPYELLYGKPYLIETLKEYTFKISPDSFFQINKPAAIAMYNKAFEMLDLNRNIVLLDLCCGTGVFSILASKKVKKTIGIESIKMSIRDAQESKKLNNVDNAEFILGLVEKKLDYVINNLTSPEDEIVAVLNPGRAGVGKKAINALRNSTRISRILYISCKPDYDSTFNNFVELSRTYSTTPPYRLTQAAVVDLFPHTYHIELLLLFKRYPPGVTFEVPEPDTEVVTIPCQ